MQINNNGLDSQGIRLAGPNDPAFHVSSDVLSTLGSAQPYTVQVLNHSTRPISSVVVTFDNPSGRIKAERIRIMPGQGIAGMLQPGGSKIFTPEPNLMAAINLHRSLAIKRDATLIIPFTKQTVTTSLDSVVYGDTGQIVGPDTYGVLDNDKQDLKAYRDMFTLLGSGADLIQALTAISNGQNKNRYDETRTMLATTYLDAIKRIGLAALQQSVKQQIDGWISIHR